METQVKNCNKQKYLVKKECSSTTLKLSLSMLWNLFTTGKNKYINNIAKKLMEGKKLDWVIR